MTAKKWMALTAVGTALLLLPRRSSRQLPAHRAHSTNDESENLAAHKKSEDHPSSSKI